MGNVVGTRTRNGDAGSIGFDDFPVHQSHVKRVRERGGNLQVGIVRVFNEKVGQFNV